jgi:hypothetical protein
MLVGRVIEATRLPVLAAPAKRLDEKVRDEQELTKTAPANS